MRIAVFGSGGIGGYFGGRLAQAGEDVTFIARGDHLKALRSSGLRVDSINGDFHLPSVKATADPREAGKVDLVMLGVKAWQVPEAAEAILPLLDEGTFVLPLQNGVEAAGQLVEKLGAGKVLGGLCQIVSFIAGPGHIRHPAFEPYVAFGELDNRISPRVERLFEVFRRTPTKVEIPPDIHAALWKKFLFISAYSGVGSIVRAPAGILRSNAGTRSMIDAAMREVLAVARARGITLTDEVVEKAMSSIDSLPEGATSSMQRDILAGRPSELEAQNGAVVRLGGKAGVPTPVNGFLYTCLEPQELRARGDLQFSS
jgi:2-dehydropantoate 2-reductase